LIQSDPPEAVTIVIPVYNGAETVPELVEDLIRTFLPEFSLEIILVNDYSQDESHDVCLAVRDSHPDLVTYISLSRNFGEHNAVMAGLHHATGNFVVTMDDDGQNPPSEATELVREAVRGRFDVVYSKYISKKHSLLRNLGSWFNDKVATFMLRKPSNLYLCSFRVLSRFLVDEIIKYDLPYPYVDGLVLRSTANIGTLPTRHNERVTGQSGYTWRKLLRLWLNMFTNFSILPLRIASAIGFGFASIGLCVGTYTMYERLQNPDLPVGWATIAVLTSILGGVQLMALGVVGEYLGRLFLGANRQPQFIVRHIHLRESDEKK